MKLPSLQQLYSGLQNVIKRFPLQFLFAISATLCWCIYIDLSDYRAETSEHVLEQLIKGIFISNLGLALVLATDLYAEAHQISNRKKWLLRLGGLLLCLLLFFVLSPFSNSADVYRIALLAFAFHLLIAFAPFVGKGAIGGFWQFNKMLFLRFLTSALYSAVLYAGLAIALVAIDGLFAVKIEWQAYLTVFAIITAGFNSIFFLAGVPSDLPALAADVSYPKGLKIFTQFVLIPLMSIYLIILLVYELKIIIIWEFPKGLVSSLILGYAVFGILSLLLVHPIKESAGNNWIKLFSRFFYVMMIPLIVLLMLAIWKRVGHYGITESRYILAVLALWLAVITIYFLFSRIGNIKVIPMSLCVLALVVSYGPQSAFSISKYSQLSRLRKLMQAKNQTDRGEIPSVVRYLVTAHGLKTLQTLTKIDLNAVEQKIESKNAYRYSQEQMLVDTALSILKVKEVEVYQSGISLTLINDENEVLKVKGYDYVVEMDSYPQPKTFNLDGNAISTTSDHQDGNLSVQVNGNKVLEVDLYKVFQEAMVQYHKNTLKPTTKKQQYYYPAKQMEFTKVVDRLSYTIVVTLLENTYNNGGVNGGRGWTSANSYLLIKKL